MFVIREAAPRPTTPNQCLFQSLVHGHGQRRRPGPQRSAAYLLCPLLCSSPPNEGGEVLERKSEHPDMGLASLRTRAAEELQPRTAKTATSDLGPF